MTLSARERRIRHPSATSNDRLLNLKENLHALFVTLSASPSPADEIFSLYSPTKGGIYTLILVSAVCLDLSAQTIVADAQILPLNPSLIGQIGPFLQKNKKIRNLPVSDEGIKVWSEVLAASVERCRGGIWEHKNASCKYKKMGKFPASITPGVSPLCGCGTGKVSAAFAGNKVYKTLIPHVDRAALGLVFAVPFYEQPFTGG